MRLLSRIKGLLKPKPTTPDELEAAQEGARLRDEVEDIRASQVARFPTLPLDQPGRGSRPDDR